MKNILIWPLAVFIVIVGCNQKPEKENKSQLRPAYAQPIAEDYDSSFAGKRIVYAEKSIAVDGNPSDYSWTLAEWQPINQLWLGKISGPKDFSGRYKVLYNANQLYVLAEIIDDKLSDTHADQLSKYWDDDCLEIFIDEDASGGDHQYNHSAFAYHIALNGSVVDLNEDKQPFQIKDHVRSTRKCKGDTCIWEMSVSVYDSTFKDYKPGNPVLLQKGKKLGFALAYCDNDNSKEREAFIGSVPIDAEDKNQAFINASYFEKVMLD